jgi:outer membrane murein-binding lipoprotein Lpp
MKATVATIMLMRSKSRMLVVTAIIMVVTAAAGCTSEPKPTNTIASNRPTGPSTHSADPIKAKIEAAYQGYWDAVVQAQNGPNADPALFDGVAQGAIVDQQILAAQQFIDSGFRRVGKPTFGELSITVDGKSARAQACVDQSNWGKVYDNQTFPSDFTGPEPIIIDFVQVDGAWLASSTAPQAEATIEC